MRNMEHVAVSIHYFPREFFVLEIATSISMLFQTADARVRYFFHCYSMRAERGTGSHSLSVFCLSRAQAKIISPGLIGTSFNGTVITVSTNMLAVYLFSSMFFCFVLSSVEWINLL